MGTKAVKAVKAIKVTEKTIENVLLEAEVANDELTKIRSEMALKMNEISAQYAQQIEDLTASIVARQNAVETYVTENRETLFTKKARFIEYGKYMLGFRKNPDMLKVVDMEKTIALLEKHGFTSAVRIKKEIVKDVVKNLPPATLKLVKAEIVEGVDVFYIKY